MVGEFTPRRRPASVTCGANRKPGLSLPLDGPKTLNGLLLEQFEDIPEAGVSLKLGDVPVEIVQTQDRAVRMAGIYLPAEQAAAPENASI